MILFALNPATDFLFWFYYEGKIKRGFEFPEEFPES